MSYAESLKRLREIQKGAGTAVPKVSKPPYGTYGTSSVGAFQKITLPDHNLPALPEPPADRTQAGLRAALAAAREGLPLTLDELVHEFGTEGEADWIEGYEPHCTPEYLRAFAEAVAERLGRPRSLAGSN